MGHEAIEIASQFIILHAVRAQEGKCFRYFFTVHEIAVFMECSGHDAHMGKEEYVRSLGTDPVHVKGWYFSVMKYFSCFFRKDKMRIR